MGRRSLLREDECNLNGKKLFIILSVLFFLFIMAFQILTWICKVEFYVEKESYSVYWEGMKRCVFG
jgi:hypothetical protein